jgi:hypothetical protein
LKQGHFQKGEADIFSLQKKYGWSEKGFLGPNGCLLPIDKRSKICPAGF